MKKSGVSRVRNKMVLVLVIANAMLFLASVVTKATNLMNLSVLLFLPIMALLIATNRCPHCGKYFRGVYWAKSSERKTLSLFDSAVVVQDLKSPQSIRLRTFLMP